MPFAVSERKRMIEVEYRSRKSFFVAPAATGRLGGRLRARAEFWIHAHAPISLAAPIMGQSDNCHYSVQ